MFYESFISRNLGVSCFSRSSSLSSFFLVPQYFYLFSLHPKRFLSDRIRFVITPTKLLLIQFSIMWLYVWKILILFLIKMLIRLKNFHIL